MDIGKRRPIEPAQFGHAAAERIAMPANVFRERINHQAGPDRLRLKQKRRREGVINHINQTVGIADCANPHKVRNLGSWICDGFDKDQFCIGLNRRGNALGARCVNERKRNAMDCKRFEQTGGIAKQVL